MRFRDRDQPQFPLAYKMIFLCFCLQFFPFFSMITKTICHLQCNIIEQIYNNISESDSPRRSSIFFLKRIAIFIFCLFVIFKKFNYSKGLLRSTNDKSSIQVCTYALKWIFCLVWGYWLDKSSLNVSKSLFLVLSLFVCFVLAI